MNQVAIRVDRLSKQYSIGQAKRTYGTMRDTVANVAAAPFRALKSALRRSTNDRVPGDNSVWALKDLSFEVKRGEVVGIIGKNGAGKSTLLKVLSRITDPTGGYAEIRGRLGSLLEVGTGFHYELTGRENIYLNGAILGMKREEIARKFDEMVAFSEVDRFIDTPVKHYSSGMYLRLAFSVAAHLEPDILLVDEVLAVGDMAFQKKCLGKMGDVASQGKTVLFVSHNLGAIKELCQSSLVLDKGTTLFRGSVVDGLSCYSHGLSDPESESTFSGKGWRGVRINSLPFGVSASVASGEPFYAEAQLAFREDVIDGQMYCIVSDSAGDIVVHQRVNSDDLWSRILEEGVYQIRMELPALWLAPSLYSLHFKFIGRTATGAEERHVSERAILDVTGTINGIGRASLAPPTKWTMSSTVVGAKTQTLAS